MVQMYEMFLLLLHEYIKEIYHEIYWNYSCKICLYTFSCQTSGRLGSKPVIQRVYEQVSGILDEAYVATDDERIESAVKAFGGKVVMTPFTIKAAQTVAMKRIPK